MRPRRCDEPDRSDSRCRQGKVRPPTTAAEAAELAKQGVELDNTGDPKAAATYRAAADWMQRQDGEQFKAKAAQYHARAAELAAQRLASPATTQP